MSELITDPSALLAAFPYSLQRDDDKAALAEAITWELVRLLAQTDCAAVLPRVDELPEAVLDILAYDLKVDWYDNEGTLEEKRNTISGCMNIHKSKGTKGAILTALKSVYDDVQVQEWFEYGGEPFHFKILIKHSHSGFEKLTRLLQKVKYYKNARSYLDETIFEMDMSPPPATAYFGTVSSSFEREDGAILKTDIPATPTLPVLAFAGMWAQSETREIGAVLHYDLI